MLRATGAQPYLFVTTNETAPITVAELAAWLKMTNVAQIAAETATLQMIIAAATQEVENYTKRELYLKTFKTYRDVFGDNGESPAYVGYPAYYYQPAPNNTNPICIRKSPFSAVTSIKYFDSNDVEQTINPTDYYVVFKESYSLIFPTTSWPINIQRQQSISIEFTAGYSEDNAQGITLPPSLKTALLAFASALYEDKGDCSSGCTCSSAPAIARAVFNQYRILDFVV
jgi:uncharacterized phiE125 gp8 family phage protein